MALITGVGEAFTVGLVKLNHATTPITIQQIESSAINPGARDILLAGAGQYDATFSAADMFSPVVSIVTTDLKTVLDVCGASVIRIAAASAYTSCDIWLNQIAEGGTREALTSKHAKISLTEGLIIPRTLTASQGGGPATMSLDIICTSDGTNAPLTFNFDQTMPSTAAAAAAWGIGPVTVGGFIAGVQSLGVNWGISEAVLAGDGDFYPTFVAAMGRRMSMSFVTSKASYLSTTAITGNAITAATAWLRQYASGGTRTANATETHISLTLSKGRIEPMSSTWSQAPGMQGFNIIAVYDGSHDPLIIDTTAAIS